MKLSEYAEREGIKYRAAWNRYHAGKIPGAYMDSSNHIRVPTPRDLLKNKAVIYARVSTHKQREDLHRQSQRLTDFAVERGLEVVKVVEEVGSGVNSTRPQLTRLLNNNSEWGVLIVEHRDRLTRVGFEWFSTFLELLDKEVIVAVNSESSEGRVEDILSLMYSFAASEYGRKGAQHRAEKAVKLLGEA